MVTHLQDTVWAQHVSRARASTSGALLTKASQSHRDNMNRRNQQLQRALLPRSPLYPNDVAVEGPTNELKVREYERL
jgi:hypothetical protein